MVVKYIYIYTNVFKPYHILHYLLPGLILTQKIKHYPRRKALFPIQMETYYLDILLQGVSLKGRHLGHVDVKADTLVKFLRESRYQCVFSTSTNPSYDL